MLKKIEKHEYVVLAIRVLLGISFALSLYTILAHTIGDVNLPSNERINIVNREINMIPWILLTFGLTFIPNYIEKKRGIHLPNVLELAIIVFIYASLFLSNRFSLYYDHRFFWWDDMLHTVSGVIIGFLGFLFVYKINRKYSMNISPLLVAIFAFTFAVTAGVLWEIVEFASDIFLKTGNQKWDMPPDTIMIGRSYQGMGLRDTMSDLIVNTVGAFVTSAVCFFLYKNEKHLSLKAMKQMFPGLKKES